MFKDLCRYISAYFKEEAMKRIFILLTLCLSQIVQAERFSSTIYSIDYGKSGELHLVRFDNSRVALVDPNDHKLMESLFLSTQRGERIAVKVNANNEVIAAQTVSASDVLDDSEESWGKDDYGPTIVRSYNSALAIHNRMRKDYTTYGECYNRAHIWAYEEHRKKGTNLMKVFMFFTERYIRRYNFKWWFHVTPMVYWGSLNSPRTLDRKYTSGPRQTKVWSDVFIKTKRACKRVKKFDDYFLNQRTQDCYHIHTSMYYVIPRDIEKRDLTGLEKVEFNDREIRRAYKNGFGRTVD